MKKDSLKKEAYQKPEIKSEPFDLGVYGQYPIEVIISAISDITCARK